MTKHFLKTTALFSLLSLNLLFIGSANAIGKVYLDQAGINATEVSVKMNIFRTGGTVTLKGCPEHCPSGLTANKKTKLMANGKKIKRKQVKKYSGKSAYVKYFKASRSVILIDWK